jgi:hypothetical protein
MDDQIAELAKIKPDEVLYADDKYFKLGDSRLYIERLVEGAQDIIQNADFWNELPRPTKNTIHSETETILRVINTIQQNKDNPQWLTANLDAHIESISTQYNVLYPWLVTAIRDYKNSLNSQRREANALLRELRTATKTAEDTSKLASEASSSISTSSLSKYFDEVANGNSAQRAKLKRDHKKSWLIRLDSYSGESRRWFYGVLISVIATGATAVIVFWGVKEQPDLTLQGVIARGLILAAPAYAIKFSARNYTTAKHFKATNVHRAVVMKTLFAFIQREEISPEIRALVISEAAKQVFKPDDIPDGHESDSVIEIPVPWKKV